MTAHTGHVFHHSHQNAPDPRYTTPFANRWRLATALRQVRLDAGITQGQLAKRIGMSASKVLRSEHGDTAITLPYTHGVLAKCGVTDPDVLQHWIAVTRASIGPSNFAPYAAIAPAQARLLFDYEEAATHIQSLHVAVVPDLLLDPEYARRISHGFLDTDEASGELADRLLRQRQDIIRSGRTKVDMIVLEGLLDWIVRGRVPAGPATAQLRRLLDVSAEPHVTLQVLHYGAEVVSHDLPSGNYHLSYLDDSDPVLFLHNLPDLRHHIERANSFAGNFELLSARSLSPEDSRALIEEKLDQRVDREHGRGLFAR